MARPVPKKGMVFLALIKPGELCGLEGSLMYEFVRNKDAIPE